MVQCEQDWIQFGPLLKTVWGLKIGFEDKSDSDVPAVWTQLFLGGEFDGCCDVYSSPLETSMSSLSLSPPVGHSEGGESQAAGST